MRKLLLRFITHLLLVVAVAGCHKTEKPITCLDDAKNATIGVMTGTTGEEITKARFPHAQIKSFDDVMDAVAALKSGQLEAIVTALPTAIQVSKKNPDFITLKESLQDDDSCIALRKGDDKLLADLNRIISGLKTDGTLASMNKRWFKADLSPYEELNLTLPKEGATLKIGVCATREPLSFVDKNGRVTGHDGELARLISVKLNRPLEFLNMKFMALIPALQSGKVDLIISGMTATNERKKSVNFTQPYFANAQVMLVKKAGAAVSAVKTGSAKLTSADDLKDKRIGVLQGSTHEFYAVKTYPRATVLQYKTPSDMLLAVKAGKADAAIYSRDELVEYMRSNDDLGFVGANLYSTPVGIGFHQQNDELRLAFNRFLAQIKKDGSYNDMIRRWMEQGTTDMPQNIAAGSGKPLLAGLISDNGLPFTVLKDNRLIGFNIELIDRFGAFINRRIQYVDMEFGSLIAAASTKKIDMIAAVMAITEERKKRIAFSEPYYNLDSNAFALKRNIEASTGATNAVPSFLTGIVTSFQSNIIHEKRYLLILDGLKTTIIISIFATLLGTLLGALVCFMRMSKNGLLNLPAKVYIAILRGTPVLVILMLIFYVVFASVNINPVIVAVIAFGMNFAAYSAEIFRTGIEGVDKGQTEAGIAMGFTRVSTFLHIVLPQMVRRILPVYKGEFISLVKMTSIVGYIAVQDLTKASDIIRSRTFDAFFPLVMVAILYFLISWTLMQLLEYLERRADPKYKPRKAGRS